MPTLRPFRNGLRVAGNKILILHSVISEDVEEEIEERGELSQGASRILSLCWFKKYKRSP